MEAAAEAVIASDVCQLEELVTRYEGDVGEARGLLRLGEEWLRRWSTTWKVGGGEVSWPVRDMAGVPVRSSRPTRGFTWQRAQRHHPGLEYMVSTGRAHGFESIAESRLLVALDFLGASEVLSQPFRLDFEHADGKSWHVPDFLAVVDGGMWLLDVRPAHLIKASDALKFAASRETAAACGWRYSVVSGWRPHVFSVLDHLSSRRRPARDLLGMRDQVLAAVGGGVLAFGELAEATSLPAVARAHIVRLLWRRELGVDLGRPLLDSSLVWATTGSRRRV
ncbi:TnsA-like heteromeric transposase endonuclease subunit [Streptomyces sp. AV19]|uniref:TnsA-like heteromeric transposase endonuclease subunit n=1 Tax=Streptomyces sp. AV19 TaxID=2793068 RepID=UPI0018FF0FEA|nr:TnsA-like heteromeric transposase endonuclease subunit [Streptomyces sp. AV19]